MITENQEYGQQTIAHSSELNPAKKSFPILMGSGAKTPPSRKRKRRTARQQESLNQLNKNKSNKENISPATSHQQPSQNTHPAHDTQAKQLEKRWRNERRGKQRAVAQATLLKDENSSLKAANTSLQQALRALNASQPFFASIMRTQ
ncbi:hypothetical protein HGRIS_011325 [Hohenbuehelia grisea]|uniref:BZIP domain-containing protein n=1 Tax=Hohenbuehelia grisea TaxID=104357 RepID=A0ABR3JUY8_9AGAR